MRTYAEYLSTMTVKALNVIAKAMGLTGYSKLRKDALVTAIDSAIATLDVRWESEETIRGWHTIALDMNNLKVNILSVEAPKDHAKIADIMRRMASAPRKVAPVTFSHTPVKAPESAPKARIQATPIAPTNSYASESTDDLTDAYKHMTATLHNARGITHAKLAAKVRLISKELRARKVNMKALYV